MFSYFTPDDMNSGCATSPHLPPPKRRPHFGVLHIPDITVGEQKNVVALINAIGLADIHNFVQAHSGITSTSRKGVLVAHEQALAAANTFSTRHTARLNLVANSRGEC